MNKLFSYQFLLLCILLFVKCSYFQKKEIGKPIAKVNNTYLYEKDLPKFILETNSKEDSLLAVQRYIDKWALTNLLLDKAKFNLPKEKQAEFDEMAKQYKIQLYINAYKNALVDKNMKNDISEESIMAYYEERKENFKIKESLLKLRYLAINSNLNNVDEIKSKFSSFTNEDKDYLHAKSLEFKIHMLNDSVWVRLSDVVKQLPVLETDFGEKIEQEIGKTQVYNDSVFSYFVHINEVKKPNDIPPISYLKPTIVQILENKKKLELNNQLEKDIINDAIQNNEYETY